MFYPHYTKHNKSKRQMFQIQRSNVSTLIVLIMLMAYLFAAYRLLFTSTNLFYRLKSSNYLLIENTIVQDIKILSGDMNNIPIRPLFTTPKV